jgi:NAD(P)-dependent dehydrogenase (short-subunit alcohol dehydrogenase family)
MSDYAESFDAPWSRRQVDNFGAAVVINYRDRAQQAEQVVDMITKRGGKAFAMQADMRNVGEIHELVSRAVGRYGKLDIVVSNAGIEHFSTLEDVTEADFDRVFGVNTRGQFFAIQHAARHLPRGSRVVCTSSTSASKGMARHALYAASKAAVEALARNLAVELGPRGITVNAIVPRPTATDMAAASMREYLPPGVELNDALVENITPLGRIGSPEDIAEVVAFLVSDASGWITGQAIHVSGGSGLGGW